MVSFDELETFLAFLVFSSAGKPLIMKDFRSEKDVKKFPPDRIQSLLSSAFEVSQGLPEEAISEGQIYHVDFASMRIAGINRREGLFCLIAAASASLLDIEFKLRTLMTLFLGSFSHKLDKKRVKLTLVEQEEFEEAIQTVMAGESRYMGESMKKTVEEHLNSWIENEESVRGACISSFTGAVIVNRMGQDILPAAVRAIRGAFAAHLEKPKFFLGVTGVANLFVYILGEGLLLLVDTNPKISPAKTVEVVESEVGELKKFIL